MLVSHSSSTQSSTDPWPWIITAMLLCALIVVYMIWVLPMIEAALPGQTLYHWLVSLAIGIAVVCLMLFLVQPAIDSAFRGEAFEIYWLMDMQAVPPAEKIKSVSASHSGSFFYSLAACTGLTVVASSCRGRSGRRDSQIEIKECFNTEESNLRVL